MSVIQFKEANCKNCYKCIRSCPIKAIAFKNEQAKIIEDDCVLCGNCLTVCPQNAKSVKSDIDKVRSFIARNEKVYASLAPSFVAAFENTDPRKVYAVLKKLGFTHIEETAIGAAQVSKEYEKLLCEKKMTNIITSSCPTINFLIEKYYPDLLHYLAPVVSPMIAHAKMMRSIYGSRIKVVFIGPCISKKEECNDLQNEGVVDAVITFEDLEKWVDMENISFDTDDNEEIKGIKNSTARFYPAPGGVIKTLGSEERKNYKCVSIDGIDRCIHILESMRSGETANYFIEMNSCAGGCLGGPCIKHSRGGPLEARDRLVGYARRNTRDLGCTIVEDVKINLSKKFINRSKEYNIPDETVIRDILSKIGKFNKDMELNCGACGYSTCRDKAIAVHNNKADLHMCLPYMRERAESISNIIIHSTPNAILALNRDLCIQEFNLSAQKLLQLGNSDDAYGKYIFDVLDCPDFEQVLETGQSIIDKKYYYEKYDITVEQSILYVQEHNNIIAILKDITNQEKQQQHIYKVRSETVDIAQKVIDKQMRVAQEIASLLGETTAETKVALTKLKNSIQADVGDKK